MIPFVCVLLFDLKTHDIILKINISNFHYMGRWKKFKSHKNSLDCSHQRQILTLCCAQTLTDFARQPSLTGHRMHKIIKYHKTYHLEDKTRIFLVHLISIFTLDFFSSTVELRIKQQCSESLRTLIRTTLVRTLIRTRSCAPQTTHKKSPTLFV